MAEVLNLYLNETMPEYFVESHAEEVDLVSSTELDRYRDVFERVMKDYVVDVYNENDEMFRRLS